MSGGGERQNHPGHSADAGVLQSSNLTSEYFLGTVPRRWMLGRTVTNIPSTTIQESTQQQTVHRSDAAFLSPGPITYLQATNDGQRSPFQEASMPTGPTPTPTTNIVLSSCLEMAQNSSSEVETFSTNIDMSVDNSNSGQVARAHNGHSLHARSPRMNDSPTSDRLSDTNDALVTMSTLSINPASQFNHCSYADQTNMSKQIVASSVNQYPPHHVSSTSRSSANQSTSVNGSASGNPLVTLPTSTPGASATTPPVLLATIPTRRFQGQPRMPTNPQTQFRQMPAAGPSSLPGAPRSLQSSQIVYPTYMQILDRKVSAITAKIALNAVDTIRITWLRAACQHGDVFYLILHQLCCIQTVHPHFLVSNLSFLPCHLGGLCLLSHILANNSNVTPDVMIAFCGFVAPIVELTTDQSLQPLMPKAKAFLEHFETSWEALRIKVHNRCSPPSQRELAEEIGLDQRVLSQTIYTNFFYIVCPNADESLTQKAFNLFKTSQDLFFRRQRGLLLSLQQDLSSYQELQAYTAAFHRIMSNHPQRTSTTSQPMQPNPNFGALAPSLPATWRGSFPNLVPAASSGSAAQSVSAPSDEPAPATGFASSTPSHLAANTQASLQPGITFRLLPIPGQLLPIIVNTNPNRSALHQAHLSNPPLLIGAPPKGIKEGLKYYSFLEFLAGEPKVIDSDTVFETWSITVPAEVFERRAKSCPVPKSNPFGKAGRIVRNGCVIFQLRCIQVTAKDEVLSEADHSSSTTYWPEHVFISISEIHLEFRRKILHGRDLPVDVTHIVQQGANDITLSYHSNKQEAGKSFAIVLEAVQIVDHITVLTLPQPIDVQVSLEAITQPLRKAADDEDIVMADAHVSIDLIDPFTARIFDRPVRGSTCRHRECFDLEAFLQSRSCRNKDGLVQPEEWKCPLCGKDARPSSLVVDLFLLQVKEKLIAEGKGDTKAILVKDDGSWEAKVENINNTSVTGAIEKSGITRPSTSPSCSTDGKIKSDVMARTHSSTPTTVQPEIIELLDEDDE